MLRSAATGNYQKRVIPFEQEAGACTITMVSNAIATVGSWDSMPPVSAPAGSALPGPLR